MGSKDAASVALADVINGLIEVRLCRELHEPISQPDLIFKRLCQSKTDDAEFKDVLKISIGSPR